MNTIKLQNGNKVMIREAVLEDAEQLLTISRSVMEEDRYMVTRSGELN